MALHPDCRDCTASSVVTCIHCRGELCGTCIHNHRCARDLFDWLREVEGLFGGAPHAGEPRDAGKGKRP